jgi:hypothetical protein
VPLESGGGAAGPATAARGGSSFDQCVATLERMGLLSGADEDDDENKGNGGAGESAGGAVCRPAPPCPLNGAWLPPLRGDFIAVSEFWYARLRMRVCERVHVSLCVVCGYVGVRRCFVAFIGQGGSREHG